MHNVSIGTDREGAVQSRNSNSRVDVNKWVRSYGNISLAGILVFKLSDTKKNFVRLSEILGILCNRDYRLGQSSENSFNSISGKIYNFKTVER